MHTGRLILENARITRPGLPPFEGHVLVEDGLIAAVRPGRPERQASIAERIDCRGAALIPGFEDPHCHPLALGSALLSADCRPASVSDIAGLQRALAAWAATNPDEPVVRGFGYDELGLRERRHPDRNELDAAVDNRPVVLTHSSGHAEVLNTAALRRCGITSATDEPGDGYIDREPDSGEPSGLLLEMSHWLDERLPGRGPDRAKRYAQAASQEFVRNGVTAVTDAGHLNDESSLATWGDLVARRTFLPRLTVMTGHRAMRGSGVEMGAVERGPIKVMLTLVAGRMAPSGEELAEIIIGAANEGFQVAVHAVEKAAVSAVCESIQSIKGRGLRLPPVRVEHASECPPAVSRALKAAGVTVVTQPGFIFARGDRYFAARLSGDGVPARHLYPIGRWQADEVPVVASSDAPFGPVSPVAGIAAASTRRTANGRTLAPSERIPVVNAMKLYFRGSESSGSPPGWARLMPGQRADLALLDVDPQEVDAEAIERIRCRLTVVGGQVAWMDL